MTEQPPWTPPPPPPGWGDAPGPAPKRPGLLPGILLGFFGPPLLIFAATALPFDFAGLLVLAALGGPVVVGVILLVPENTRRWGLGVLIGWALDLVVGAGLCVAILVSYNNGTS